MAVLLVIVMLPSAASATTFTGSANDPTGDGPSPALDITQAAARYDSEAGELEFDIRLAAAPTADVQVTAGVGHRDAEGNCNVPFLAIGAFFPDGSTVWVIDRDGTSLDAQGQADRSVAGSRLVLEARDRELEGFQPSCGQVILSDPSDSSVYYDTIGPFAVTPPPPRPALRARIVNVGPLKRRATKPVRVTIANPGTAVARNVSVRVAARGAATVRPRVRKLGAIAPGRSRTVRFRVTANPRGKGQVRLVARATGRGVKAAARSAFRIHVPKPPPPPARGGMAGRIFWGFESYRWDRSSELVFLHFTGPRFVRWGIPPRGLVNCRRQTARVKDGKMQPGCLRYTYNRRNGQIRIGNVRGTFRGGKLKLNMSGDAWPTDGDTWYAAVTPKRGARFNTRLINRGYYGACGISPFCRTWKENLELTRDGRFGRQKSSLTTSGAPGLPFVAINLLGPDEKGRYQVLGNGRIRFRYASGRTEVETLLVQTNARGRPDPVREGLLVGSTWFYRETDD